MAANFSCIMHATPPLCMNCKHFAAPPSHLKLDITHGMCRRYVTRNLVHGKLEYFFADEAREKVCLAAKDFEPKVFR